MRKGIHSPRVTVNFPVLSYLQIWESDHDSWPIQAITPALTAYDEKLLPGTLPIGYAIVTNVKYLQWSNVRELHLYPSLEILQLNANSNALATLVEQFEQFEGLCPNLWCIKFYTRDRSNEEENRIRLAEHALLAARPHVEFVWIKYPNRMTPLPGSKTFDMCGHAI